MQCNVASPYDGEYHLAQYLNLGADWVSLLVQVSLRAHCSPVPKPALDTTLSPSPPQAMVRSTSPRPDPLSITHAVRGNLAQNLRVLCTRGDLIADTDSDPQSVAPKPNAGSYIAGQAMVVRPSLGQSPVPSAVVGPRHSEARSNAPTMTVHTAVIICSAIGGAVLVAVILASIYVMRIRRKGRRIRDSMNVLGSGASPRP
jgi:hypothetical protein